MGQEPEGHPPREAGKRLIIQGDKLSQLLRGSSLADCEVKTELSETGKALSLLLYFSTSIFFFFNLEMFMRSWTAQAGELPGFERGETASRLGSQCNSDQQLPKGVSHGWQRGCPASPPCLPSTPWKYPLLL